LHHYQEAVKYRESHAPEAADKKPTKESVQGYAKIVEARRIEFNDKTAASKGLEKARAALMMAYRFTDAANKQQQDPKGLGLALLALQQLQEIKPGTLDPQKEMPAATQLQFELLILMGRSGEFDEHINQENLRAIVGPKLRLMHAAAKGDYAVLDEILGEGDNEPRLDSATYLAASVVGTYLAMNSVTHPTPQLRFAHERAAFLTNAIVEELRKAVDSADLRLLRGLLLLEAGDTQRARPLLENSLRLVVPHALWPDQTIAARYAYLLKEQQE
jgi:hypothetical protein